MVACAIALKSGEIFDSAAKAKKAFNVGQSTDLRQWLERLGRLESFVPDERPQIDGEAAAPRLSTVRLVYPSPVTPGDTTARACEMHEIGHHPCAGLLSGQPKMMNSPSVSSSVAGHQLRREFSLGFEAGCKHYKEELGPKELTSQQAELERTKAGLAEVEQLYWFDGPQDVRTRALAEQGEAKSQVIHMLQRCVMQAHVCIRDAAALAETAAVAGARGSFVEISDVRQQCAELAARNDWDRVASESLAELQARLPKQSESFWNVW